MKNNKEKTKHYNLLIWLYISLITVFIMIIVGGITRLTDSGLSLVEWKPIMGSIPPLNNTDWEIAFTKYKQFPEFQKINFNMTLSEFKQIYFWEYLHRMIGRFLGLLFIIPYLVFKLKKIIPKEINSRLLLLFSLGGLQGIIGWYMVKSGLVDQPDVSHYRLAIHLSIAILIYSLILWLIFKLKNNKFKYSLNRISINEKKLFSKSKKLSKFLTIAVCTQILYGVLMAGLKGGLGFNTWPKMGNQWIPLEIFNKTPFYLNFFEATYVLQFIHRWLGAGVAIAAIFFSVYLFNWVKSKTDKEFIQHIKFISILLIIIVSIQFFLGVSSLIFTVPIITASLHQIGAIILLSICLYINYMFHHEKTNL